MATSHYVLAAVIAVSLIAAAVIFSNPGLLRVQTSNAQANLGQPLQQLPPTTQQNGNVNNGVLTPSTYTLGAGQQFTVTPHDYDTLSQATLTEATDVTATILTLTQSGQYVIQGTAGTSNPGAVATMGAFDNGNAYLQLMRTDSSHHRLLDVKSFKAANPKVQEVTYSDINGDGVKEFVAKISTTGIAPGQYYSNQKPDLSLQVPYYQIASSAFTISSPTNSTSVGTTPGTLKYPLFQVTGTAAKAIGLREFAVKINTTSYTKIQDGSTYIDMPFGRYYLSQKTNFLQDGTSTTWVFTLGSDIHDSPLLYVANNGNPTINIPTTVALSLASNDKIKFQLILRQIDEANGSFSDQTGTTQFSA